MDINTNFKRISGGLLTILGIAGLMYTIISFVSYTPDRDIRLLVTLGVLGFAFLVSGVSLVATTLRTTKGEAF